ncbi:hypothetical protein [Sphingopyxis sp.]|uniref:hypothetical protein n=1 Tax=Sphingopyxis sp. TaxID=1908224 RepID=UPI003D6CAC39
MRNDFRTGTRARAREGETRGPNKIAADCRDAVAELDAAIDAAPTKRAAKPLRQKRRLMRDIERWAKSCAGYVEPVK